MASIDGSAGNYSGSTSEIYVFSDHTFNSSGWSGGVVLLGHRKVICASDDPMMCICDI